MRPKKASISLLLVFIILFFTANSTYADLTVNDYREIERIVRRIVKEEISPLEKRIAVLEKGQDAINTRIDDLMMWLQIMLGILVLILGGIVGLWFSLWKSHIELKAEVKTHLKEAKMEGLIMAREKGATYDTEK